MNDNIHTTQEVQLPPGVSYSELRRKFPVLKNVSKREFLSRPQLQIQVLGERLDASEQSSEQQPSTNFSQGEGTQEQQPAINHGQELANQFAYGGTDDFFSEQSNNNGLVEFSGGGTHEQNSNGGIPLGYDGQGNINTVEDGETQYDFDDGSYIFSNRIDTQGNFKSAEQAANGNNEYAKGGTIHIDPKNRGKFTETKRRTGKSTEELTHSKNPLTRKRAIFAQNARKWQHAYGGDLMNNIYAAGGGLSAEDRGSDKKPYPSVQADDFAGGGRSYPIPTEADAIDALRLAGLHGRDDVRAKVFAKYPNLKHADGGFLDKEMEDYEDKLYNTPIDESFYNSEPLPSPMSKTIQRAQGGDLIIKRIFGGVNIYAEGGEIDPPVKTGDIRQVEEQPFNSKLKDIALNPLTAMGYKARGQDIPEHFARGTESGAIKRNILDNVVDFVNPAFYVKSADRGINDLLEGDFAGAAGEALNFIPAFRGSNYTGKLAKQAGKAKLLSKAIKGIDDTMQHTVGRGLIGHAYGGNLIFQALNKTRK